MVTSENSKSSMITDPKRSLLNWSVESTNAVSSPPDSISKPPNMKNGLQISSPPDSSDSWFSPPLMVSFDPHSCLEKRAIQGYPFYSRWDSLWKNVLHLLQLLSFGPYLICKASWTTKKPERERPEERS